MNHKHEVATAPFNIEAEQALLGAILLDNEALRRVPFLHASHFYQPAHQKIFDVVASLIRNGKVVEPITLKTFLPPDLEFAGTDLDQYLKRLLSEATTTFNAAEFGRAIHELAIRRGVITILQNAVDGAKGCDPDADLEQQIEAVRASLGEIQLGTKSDDHGLDKIPLSVDRWLERDLPAPDWLLGDWLSTTSRALWVGPTGIGKTNFGMALAAHCAAGRDFLHWRVRWPATVLYIDGEMSARLFKSRIADTMRRLGTTPSGLHLFNHEDLRSFAPLNTPAGSDFILQLIEHLGGVDLVIFDNVMALLDGDQKDEESWQRVLPLVSALTKRSVGQVWLHHTGHDASRGYGTKTREWRMDTVIHLTEQKRPDTDVSFSLEFVKARERTPRTRRDFEEATIALVDDEWTSTAVTAKKSKLSPLGSKFLGALATALASGPVQRFETWNAIDADQWRAECETMGLLDKAKPVSARSLFNKYKRELISAEQIGCHNDLVWLR